MEFSNDELCMIRAALEVQMEELADFAVRSPDSEYFRDELALARNVYMRLEGVPCF